MKYQVYSKLFGAINKLPSAKVDKQLILLGDCFPLYSGNFYYSKRLRDYCSDNWSKVYVVPGIVEICGNGMHSWVNNFDKFQNFINESPNSNITILNNTEHHDGDELLIGSTFWCGLAATQDLIKRQPHLTVRNVEQWAKDDAEFVSNSIKNASIQGKHITVATYFHRNIDDNKLMKIFISNIEKSKIMKDGIKGEWYTGMCEMTPP